MNFRRTLGLAVAGAALLTVTGGGAAYAIPYGYAESDFENFQIIIGGGAGLTNGAVTVNTSQDYPGSSNLGSTDTQTFGSGGNTMGVHANNAFGGPNATFTSGSPAAVGASSTFVRIGPSALMNQYGAQAAASVGSNNVFIGAGDASYDIVENGGLLGGGNLTATGSQTETVFTLSGNTTGGTVDFAFDAQANVKAFVTVAGETASAETTNTITQFKCVGPNGDCTETEEVGTPFQPGGLQFSVTTGPTISASQAGTGGFLHGYQHFDSGQFTLDPNTNYVFGLSSDSTESTSTSNIPEPTSLAVLGSGLMALGAAIRRRRKKA